MKLLVCALVLCLAPADDPEHARLLDEAEQAMLKRDYTRAVAIYAECRKDTPGDPSVQWRLARVYVLMAEVAAPGADDSLLRKGEESSRACIGLDPGVAEGHTWLAASLGYQALKAPSAKQIQLSNELLAETARAIALNPNDDVAWSIRGSTFRALGNVSWLRRELAKIFLGAVPEGGFPEAEEALGRAIAIAPDVMRHQYELAVLYLDTGRLPEAEQLLLRASAMPVRIASDIPRLKTIDELLAEHFPDRTARVDRGKNLP